MTRIDEIRELYAFNRWANERVLDAVSKLDAAQLERDLGGSFRSVLGTLVHLVEADWIWISRWRGESPTGSPGWDLSTLDALRARWDEVQDEREDFVAGLGEADLDRVLSYRRTNGEALASSMSQMLRHVVNHSSYHRGQVIHMLRQLGADAVSTDLIRFYRERAVAGA